MKQSHSSLTPQPLAGHAVFGPRFSDLGLRPSVIGPPVLALQATPDTRSSVLGNRTSDFRSRTSDFGSRPSVLGPRFPLLLAAVLCAFTTVAQETPPPADPPELVALRAQYEQRREVALRPFREQHIRQLNALLQRHLQLGQAREALAVQRYADALTRGEEPPEAGDTDPAELDTLRDVFSRQRDTAGRNPDHWYKVQLESLLQRFMAGGRLEDAVAVEVEIKNRIPVAEDPVLRRPPRRDPGEWTAPGGGRLNVAEGVVTLRGSGRLAEDSSIALNSQKLTQEFTISGQIRMDGLRTGLVFCYDPRSRKFWSLSSGAGPWSGVFEHRGKQRSALTKALPVPFTRGSWTPFTIRRKDTRITIDVADNSTEIEIPDLPAEGLFGIINYDADGETAIREVRFR